MRNQEKRSGVKNVIYLPNGFLQANFIVEKMSNRQRSQSSPTVSTRANCTNRYELYGSSLWILVGGEGKKEQF
jgi:hypothetical protein